MKFYILYIKIIDKQDEVTIDKEYFKEMLLLHKRDNYKETVIG